MIRIAKIIRRYGRELTSVRDYLFAFLVLWTGVILIMGWLDFFIGKLLLPDLAVTSYLILLGVYILHKEVNRWTGVKMNMKPGEMVVYVWWTSLLIMIVVGFFTALRTPDGVKAIAFDILGALLASEISKSVNSYKMKQGSLFK